MVLEPKPTFTSQKDGFGVVFLRKTIFLRGKSWFSYEKPSFYEAKPKKPSFSKSPPHSLKKMGFLFFGFASYLSRARTVQLYM